MRHTPHKHRIWAVVVVLFWAFLAYIASHTADNLTKDYVKSSYYIQRTPNATRT